MWSNILDRISFLSLFFVVVLLPVFFLPFTKISVDISKGLLVVIGLAVSIIFWALARFSDGKIRLPKSYLLLSGLGILVVVLLSAVFSASKANSLFGSMFDVGTFWFMLAAFLLMFFSALILGTREKARAVLLGIIISATVVLVFQVFRLFLPTQLSLGVLGGKLGNLVGSWNSFGIFAGFSTLMSLFMLEFFVLSKMGKILLSALMVLSLFLLAAVNYLLIWEVLGVLALVIFVYKMSLASSSTGEGTDKKPFPAYSFAIVMVSLMFFISGQFIGSYIPTHLQITNSEVSPSLKATILTTSGVLKAKPILGIGPNMFNSAWSLYRPAEINSSVFWNVPFNTGSGLIPTLVATTGILGILSWLIFFVIFIFAGAKSIFGGIQKSLNGEVFFFFAASLYLFIFSFVYFTGSVMSLLALAFTGIFIGLSAKNRENGEMSMEFLSDHRKSFFSILSFVLVVIVAAGLSFKYLERFTSVPYFQKALAAQTVPDAQTNINRALSLYTNDLYWRTFAQIYLINLNNLAQKAGTLTDADKADLQQSFNQAVSGSTLAINFNPKNFLNYEMLGDVYNVAASLGVKDAYDKSIQAYNLAAGLNPTNPGTQLALARLSFANRKVEDAKTYANKALALKSDYIDALIFLSQVAKNQGNTQDAISYAQKALAVNPTNADLIKYVNSLKNPSAAPAPAPTDTPQPNTKKGQ